MAARPTPRPYVPSPSLHPCHPERSVAELKDLDALRPTSAPRSRRLPPRPTRPLPPRPLSVYLTASRSRALYVGVTSDVRRRLAEHRAGRSAHTARYRVDRLVRVETYAAPRDTLAREKQLKGWSRAKKVALVESDNPTWRDLDASRYGWTAEPSEAPGRGGERGRGGAQGRGEERGRGGAPRPGAEARWGVRSEGTPKWNGPRRDPSTPLRSAQDDGAGERRSDRPDPSWPAPERETPAPVTPGRGRPHLPPTPNVIPSGGRSPESRDLDAPHAAARLRPERRDRPTPPTLSERGPTAPPTSAARPAPPALSRRGPATPPTGATPPAPPSTDGEATPPRHGQGG